MQKKNSMLKYCTVAIMLLCITLLFPVKAQAAKLYAKQFKKGADLIIFAGQSNMMGHGDASLAPKLTKGAGYAYNVVTAKNKLATLREPFGYKQDSGYLVNGEYATGSMVTAFCNAYYKETKTPVIAVPATVIGSGSVGWSEVLYKDVIKRTNTAYKAMKKMKIPVRHVYLVWMQGENDVCASTPAKDYEKRIGNMLKTITEKSPVEKCMLIQTGSIVFNYGAQADADPSEILKAQVNICKHYKKQVVMISQLTPKLNDSYFQRDRLHLTQEALNKVGTDAGRRAGRYAKKN